MGRFTGYWWSPDAKSIAYEEADARPASRCGTSPTRSSPDQPPQPQFYPRPGKKNVSGPARRRPRRRRRDGLGRVGPQEVRVPGGGALGQGRPADAAGAGPQAAGARAAAGRPGDGQDDDAADRDATRPGSTSTTTCRAGCDDGERSCGSASGDGGPQLRAPRRSTARAPTSLVPASTAPRGARTSTRRPVAGRLLPAGPDPTRHDRLPACSSADATPDSTTDVAVADSRRATSAVVRQGRRRCTSSRRRRSTRCRARSSAAPTARARRRAAVRRRGAAVHAERRS